MAQNAPMPLMSDLVPQNEPDCGPPLLNSDTNETCQLPPSLGRASSTGDQYPPSLDLFGEAMMSNTPIQVQPELSPMSQTLDEIFYHNALDSEVATWLDSSDSAFHLNSHVFDPFVMFNHAQPLENLSTTDTLNDLAVFWLVTRQPKSKTPSLRGKNGAILLARMIRASQPPM
ncbi:hypothetical protein AtubIFM54640_010124 [Aspergillus tubingensis]|nr:hypothetical protein AtubIFM54640_010124 [Aspergillus tubingensis]